MQIYVHEPCVENSAMVRRLCVVYGAYGIWMLESSKDRSNLIANQTLEQMYSAAG